jgi:hypothetical protein
MDWYLEDQEIVALLRLKTYLEVDRRVSGSLAQSESIKLESSYKVPWKISPISAIL